ncbi:hypothetical protein Tco_1097500 [Tanacetum coccineum]
MELDLGRLEAIKLKREQPTSTILLMAYASSGSSSSSDSEVDSCSKTCVKAYVSLKEQYDSLNSDYNKSQFNLLSYKAGLESVETRLAHYKKNEAVFEENINVLKLECKTGLGYNAVTSTTAQPAVEKFVSSTEMLDNQENNKRYHVVPPPLTGNFIPSKPDIMFLDEVIESEHLDVITVVTPSNAQKDEIVHELIEWNSDDESEVDVIPRVMNKTMRSSYDEIKFVKSTSEIVEKVRTPKHNKHIPRGNQRNWNNLMSQRLGTVRPVKTAGSKPTVNHPRPISNAYKKGYSQVTRPFNKYSANKNSIFNKKVNTVRVKDTTARDRAVVSENKGKGLMLLRPQHAGFRKPKIVGNPQQKDYKE